MTDIIRATEDGKTRITENGDTLLVNGFSGEISFEARFSIKKSVSQVDKS